MNKMKSFDPATVFVDVSGVSYNMYLGDGGGAKECIHLSSILGDEEFDCELVGIDPIETMVDIRDAIFTSGADIQSARGGRRWFQYDGIYYIDDSNVFIITNTYSVVVMINEEKIYERTAMFSSQLFIAGNLLKASDINPEYFGINPEYFEYFGDCLK